eukprot:gnl/TRDRNA2_/TRDRNA2_166825_c0_seq1.p2 gnl/TRDRNA2_/TRDRNA2_166825_c0~~gnl/TRDRNA2_/TRDRNA2_166825_c0_seq1.p2  ORF type:complete len:101 (+),score=5.80 gnl/TRDRNA2_/TRDRNA2_166825_c0_seq1:216-518(+)
MHAMPHLQDSAGRTNSERKTQKEGESQNPTTKNQDHKENTAEPNKDKHDHQVWKKPCMYLLAAARSIRPRCPGILSRTFRRADSIAHGTVYVYPCIATVH